MKGAGPQRSVRLCAAVARGDLREGQRPTELCSGGGLFLGCSALMPGLCSPIRLPAQNCQEGKPWGSAPPWLLWVPRIILRESCCGAGQEQGKWRERPGGGDPQGPRRACLAQPVGLPATQSPCWGGVPLSVRPLPDSPSREASWESASHGLATSSGGLSFKLGAEGGHPGYGDAPAQFAGLTKSHLLRCPNSSAAGWGVSGRLVGMAGGSDA